MPLPRRPKFARSRAAAAAIGLGLLAGGPAASRTTPPGPEPVGSAAATRLAAGPVGIDPAWLALGEAARRCGFAAARELAAPRLAEAGTRTVLGLLAHAHEETGLALELLEGGAPAPLLDDWRLYVLADVAAARRRPERARAALGELLARHPDSPLRADALVRLAELAWESGDAAAALERIAQGRRERLPRGREVALEQLAFQIATARRDAAALRDAARRLLVIDPLAASKMRVVDLVAARGGGSDWRLWLASDELVERAAALLDSDLPAGALTTLAAVPPGERGLDWRLLEARALTASNRGPEAFATLAAAGPADDAVRLDWERARAARAAGDAARNPTVSGAVRQHWQRVERERLLAVVRGSGSGDELQLQALRRLAAAYLEQGRRDEATAALRQLVTADPSDSTGARPLWEAGWREYLAGRLETAIGIWRDQAELYPKSPWTRSGLYWTARAHDRRHESDTARRAYLAIVASSTADFYARQAALRLADATATTTPTPAPEPWPEDPTLARVRLLTDLGLDGPARTELDLLAPRGERRATAALTALVLARSGDTRASLRELKRAFPQLGTALQQSAPPEALALYYPLDYHATITAAALANDIPAPLVFGMIHQESGFDAAARSHAGARGLMQLMPATGREVAGRLGLPWSTSRLSDPEYSVRLGTRYFRSMLGLFDGNVELALAAYNGGPGRISRLWRAAGPDAELDRFLEGLALEESRNYVKRILVLADSYRSRYPDLG